jgi:hemoglobin
MKPLTRRTAACVLLSISLLGSAHADDSVYQAWGGQAGIRAVMEDFVPRLEADARIGRQFRPENRANLVKLLTEQLCQVSGGPCSYSGAPMDKAHRDLEITKADFNALVEVLQVSMRAKGIPFPAQNRMLALLAPMHRQIVNAH